ncbi:Cytokinin riboside 5'-monophosphate phosphoribohydrolase LOG4 [Capsicum baccatum]|uniref:cytokinin riboside 5'-monophosphate phosphoribohydrolase n=1 Tax=Capsicum baccatum TaxID=33114 RepID=A0A2G2WI82_CAPBA|nr:Cytokinin riboside 5'-monophosphate phosphoribohydrolase LOG4 [Capsicum baccatum]
MAGIQPNDSFKYSNFWKLALRNYWSLLSPLIFTDHPKRQGDDDLLPPYNMVRNVMDMNAHYGGLSAALMKEGKLVWVMNVVPLGMRNTLPFIYDRGACIQQSTLRYETPLHTFEWIIDKKIIVDPIEKNDLDEAELPPPRMVNATSFLEINNQASKASKEQLQKAEYRGSIGLMDLVSQAVHDSGRHVIRVIPKTLMPRELTGETVGEVKIVVDMHQRKAEMARHGVFIALLGGYDTLDELFEVTSWAHLGIHDKPVGLLSLDEHYNSLSSFIDKAVEKGFIGPNARQIIVSAPTTTELVEKLEEYIPCHERVASKLNWKN